MVQLSVVCRLQGVKLTIKAFCYLNNQLTWAKDTAAHSQPFIARVNEQLTRGAAANIPPL